jgi:N6-L-threonylcarbamoyladenine synthase
MKILAIETSCDETSIALCEITEQDGVESLTLFYHGIHSQINIHQEFGGVFPNVARREHQENMIPLLLQGLKNYPYHHEYEESPQTIDKLKDLLVREEVLLERIKEHIIPRTTHPDLDAIFVTNGPGLEPTLWVGVHAAQALGILWDIPVIPINHMEGHIFSTLIDSNLQKLDSGSTYTLSQMSYPMLALLISGGHTECIHASEYGMYHKLGKTRDDAVGEAYDKVARMLGLPYPGGPEVSKLADEYTSEIPLPVFPRPMIQSHDFDFSFSGLKTAVLYHIQSLEEPLTSEQKIAIAYAFEQAVIDVLVHKTKKVLEKYPARTLVVAGGVAANKKITGVLENMVRSHFSDCNILMPHRILTGDNALMIALAGYLKHKKNPHASYEDIRALGRLSLS